MSRETLESELKHLIVDALMLEDTTPADIDSDAALFGEGLGLDSIDALELGMAISKRYDIELDSNDEGIRDAFRSVAALAAFVEAARAAKAAG